MASTDNAPVPDITPLTLVTGTVESQTKDSVLR